MEREAMREVERERWVRSWEGRGVSGFGGWEWWFGGVYGLELGIWRGFGRRLVVVVILRIES